MDIGEVKKTVVFEPIEEVQTEQPPIEAPQEEPVSV